MCGKRKGVLTRRVDKVWEQERCVDNVWEEERCVDKAC